MSSEDSAAVVSNKDQYNVLINYLLLVQNQNTTPCMKLQMETLQTYSVC